MRKLIAPVAALLIGIILGLAGSVENCPTEDSCYPDYTNGRWVIHEDQP